MTVVTKAFFKKCSIEDRKKFHKSSCIMPISIGQKVHEGFKLEATINLINRSFRECCILIDDTIQRYTLKISSPDKDMEYLRLKASLEGDLWLERNMNILSHLKIPFHIKRWDDFLHACKYNEKREEINLGYMHDLDYKSSFDLTIKDFLKRYEKREFYTESFNYDKAYDLCLRYLQEECACMCLWADCGYDFEVYPSGRNVAMMKTHEKYIKPFDSTALISASLYFKKNKKPEVILT